MKKLLFLIPFTLLLASCQKDKSGPITLIGEWKGVVRKITEVPESSGGGIDTTYTEAKLSMFDDSTGVLLLLYPEQGFMLDYPFSFQVHMDDQYEITPDYAWYLYGPRKMTITKLDAENFEATNTTAYFGIITIQQTSATQLITSDWLFTRR